MVAGAMQGRRGGPPAPSDSAASSRTGPRPHHPRRPRRLLVGCVRSGETPPAASRPLPRRRSNRPRTRGRRVAASGSWPKAGSASWTIPPASAGPRSRRGPRRDGSIRAGVSGGERVLSGGPGIERTPRADALAAEGVDPLALLLDAAGARGFAVHAWVNVLSLSTRRDAAMIEDLGPGAILVDRERRSLLDYPELDIPQPDRRFYRMGTGASISTPRCRGCGRDWSPRSTICSCAIAPRRPASRLHPPSGRAALRAWVALRGRTRVRVRGGDPRALPRRDRSPDPIEARRPERFAPRRRGTIGAAIR